MIEVPPKSMKSTKEAIKLLTQIEYRNVFEKIEKDYLYYDKVKYLTPEGFSPDALWSAVKLKRIGNVIKFGRYYFSYNVTTYMQKLLHEFDMEFGGTLASEHPISNKNRQYYLISSLMEEAIASSQMEGASTTRKVAKEMLRKQKKPSNKDQQMIVNNYNTIRFLVENKNAPLSPGFLLEIHSRISEKTLDNPEDTGRFRSDNNILVMDNLSGEVAHTPPTFEDIPSFIKDLCSFANDDGKYIHPIVKAVIIHFMIAFLHPFTDGNGRTARALFYWYMIKKGYWITEYLSISRIIYKKRNKYEKAFLYTEHDNNDLGYFLKYNLDVMYTAYEELKKYLDKKNKEQAATIELGISSGVNERQALILKMLIENPNTIFISKELKIILNVSVKTIRADFVALTELGYLEKIKLNQRLTGFKKSEDLNLN